MSTIRYEVRDLEFCISCGSILPLPSYDELLVCKVCKKSIELKEWNGKTIKNIYSINQINNNNKPNEGLKSEDFAGAFVDRKCVKCGNERMTYSTRQTRSADEGQTVFFSCPRCKHQEIEYS
jgi:DNA-directed RNA polymerase I subunit RPA12